MYKRQELWRAVAARPDLPAERGVTASLALGESLRRTSAAQALEAVSYTHLTLPTSGLVEISVVAVNLKKQKQIKKRNKQEAC